MILIDTNLLLYSQISSMPQHARTAEWLQRQLSSGMKVGLPWHSLLGFVRLASNMRIFGRAQSTPDSWRKVREWLSIDTVWIPQPTERHVDLLDEMLGKEHLSASSVMDAHLAALAIEHGLVLCSNDSGFARFGKLRWLNPLED